MIVKNDMLLFVRYVFFGKDLGIVFILEIMFVIGLLILILNLEKLMEFLKFLLVYGVSFFCNEDIFLICWNRFFLWNMGEIWLWRILKFVSKRLYGNILYIDKRYVVNFGKVLECNNFLIKFIWENLKII